ncbi:MAG: glycosyltransferase [Oligoflexales bacterium]|nr:glycosyltransferase [Oligoflexales bacterium]
MNYHIFFDILIIVTGIVWGSELFYAYYHLRKTKNLEDVDLLEHKKWPRVTLLIPACNEEKTIESAMTSILFEDYPDVEIILIDDRSTDRTGEIIERIASFDSRVVPLHIKKLPEGWLGKVHALRCGAERATGEYIILTDADIHYKKGCLRSAVDYMMKNELDYLSLISDLVVESWPLGCALSLFFLSTFSMLGKNQIRKTHSCGPFGMGVFALVRKDYLSSLNAFEKLKMEVIDDTGLGQIVHNAGGKKDVLYSDGKIRINWYRNIQDFLNGFEKNAFALMCGYSFKTYWLLFLPLTTLGALLPFLFIASFFDPHVWPVGAYMVVLGIMVCQKMSKRMAIPLHYSLGYPVGIYPLLFSAHRSAYFAWKNKGVNWRGTHYSLEALRRNQVVNFRSLVAAGRHHPKVLVRPLKIIKPDIHKSVDQKDDKKIAS